MHHLAMSARGKQVYKNAHKFVADEIHRRGGQHELEEHEFNLDVGDVHVNQLIPEVIDNEVMMPFPSEHACRIADPGQFVRFRRNNNTSPNTIIGFRKDGSSGLQTFRYPKESWSPEKARAHCSSHNGNFEAARES